MVADGAKVTGMSPMSFNWTVLSAVALGVYLTLSVSTMSSGHVWGDDWTLYVMHARNLLSGHAYADTGYIYNVDAPHVGAPTAPPGLPLLLVPALAAFGVNILAFKLTCFGCLVASLPFLFKVLSPTFGQRIAGAAVVLFGLHPEVWGLRDYIASEPPFILFSALALWYASRTPAEHGWWALWTGVVAGLLIYATIACRSIGIALLPALLVYGWAQRKPAAWHAGILGSCLLLLWVQSQLIVLPATYSSELQTPTGALLLSNAWGYLLALSYLFPLPLGLAKGGAAIVVVLALIGAYGVLVRGGTRGGGLRQRAASVPVTFWYVAAYLAALLLASLDTTQRYLLPILAIALACAVAGAQRVLGSLPRTRLWTTAVALALVAYYAAMLVTAARTQPKALATCGACLEMFAFIRDHTSTDAIVAFGKPRAMALLGARRSWTWSVDYSPAQFESKLRQAGVSVLVIAAPAAGLAEKYPASMQFTRLAAEPQNSVMFNNELFTVVQLGPHVAAERAGSL